MEPARLDGMVGRACNRCRQVTHPRSESYECTYCRIRICRNCLSGHDSTHKTAIVRITVVTSTGVGDTAQICARCNKVSHYCYSCLNCVHAYCRNCWSDKGINTHQHYDFGVVEPTVRQQARGDDSPCCWDANFGHCDFCQAPNKYGQPTRVCKTCHENYNELIFQCQHCQPNEGPLHDWSHELWQWRFEVTESGQNYIHCNTCNSDFHHISQLRQHPHMSYTLYQDQKRVEDAIFRSYRRCWSKQSRYDTHVPGGGDQQCSCCGHKFSPTALKYCLACDLKTKFCSHCTISATPTSLHCHPVSSFVPFSDLSRSTIHASPIMEVPMQQRTSNHKVALVEQPGQGSPGYASRSSPVTAQRQQSIEQPINSQLPELLRARSPGNVVQPAQLPEPVRRTSPVPPQPPYPVGTPQVSIPHGKSHRDVSHSNFVHSPPASAPRASHRGGIGPQSGGQVSSFIQLSNSNESFRQGSGVVSLPPATASKPPRSPQLLDRARPGGSAASPPPISPSNHSRPSQPLDHDRSRERISPQPSASASNFPHDKHPEGIRHAHRQPSPSPPVKPITRPPPTLTASDNSLNAHDFRPISAPGSNLPHDRRSEDIRNAHRHPSPSPPMHPTTRPPPTSTASDTTQPAHNFQPLSAAQTVPPTNPNPTPRPEPPLHSASAPLPPNHPVPADQEQQQQAAEIRESKITGAKMKATAAKFAKNKYVRAGAKFGAKVAISQVSSNLIGMDVSGVVDGVGPVVSVANAIGSAINASGVDVSDVVGGGGGDGGDGSDVVVDQLLLGAMQNTNPTVQINVDVGGRDWSAPHQHHRANKPNTLMGGASRFMARKLSGT